MARVHTSELVFDLAEVALPDAEGREQPLRALWAEQTVVLVHLRHFGCILCRHYAAGLRDANAELEALGARLVAVGTGGRQYAAEFVREHEIPFLVLVDKHLTTHEIIGAKHGPLWGILKPKVLAAGARALLDGQMQGKTGPNPFVFGAAHVIVAGGLLRYAWLNDDYQDNAPVEELIDAAREARRLARSDGHQSVRR